MTIPVDEIRVAVILLILLYASYTDIKRRRVDNRVWIPPMIIAAGLIGYEAYTVGALETFAVTLLSVSVIGGLAYVLFYFRVIYGADYKAFVVIALLLPTHPEFMNFPIYDMSVESTSSDLVDVDNLGELFFAANRHIALHTFGFTVLINSALCSVVYFFMNAYHNIRVGQFDIKRPLRSTCAKQIPAEEITDHHAQVIRETESNNPIRRGIEFLSNGLKGVSADFYRDYLEWHRNRRFKSEEAELSDIDEIEVGEFAEESEEWVIDDPKEDKELAEIILNKDEIWITPGIPFIVPMTLGVIFSIFLGNLWFIFIFLL